ncbi:hypothetical protein MMC16_002840 [Acarospora aff. strigata]|nr:hypothetical protein [Acarospora aff. strigata]
MAAWQSFEIGSFLRNPTVADGSGIAVVSRIPASMELWWISADGSVQDNYFYDGAGWKRFELAPRGSAVPGGIAAVSRLPGHMEVWWTGPRGSIEGAFWYDDTGRWTRYQLAPDGSATLGSAVCVQSRLPNVMNVWWIGANGSVEGCWWGDRSTPAWQRYWMAGPGSAALKTTLTSLTRKSGTEELWWVSPQGSVEGAFWYDNFGTMPWQRYQIAPAGSAAIGAGLKARSRLPNIMNMWWVAPDGSIQGSYWVDQVKPWTRYLLAGPGSASAHSGIAAVSRIPSSEEIWWVGANGSVKDAYWYEGFTEWKSFDLAPAGTARLSSSLGAVARFHSSMELWYASPQGLLLDRFWYDIPQYSFSVDVIQCNITRSRNDDTLYISASVAVAGREPMKASKTLGEHAEGFTYPGINLAKIPLSDDEIAVFTYVIVNAGHQSSNVVLKTIEDAATSLAKTGANAAAQAIGTAGGAAAGAAIGALIGSSVPVVGTLVGAALGALAVKFFGNIVDLLNPNCDGPIASAVQTFTGAELRNKLNSGQPLTHKDSNPGIDSPSGCGRNSEYYTTWSVKRS